MQMPYRMRKRNNTIKFKKNDTNKIKYPTNTNKYQTTSIVLNLYFKASFQRSIGKKEK